ncbi:predicted protein [Histoplasma capsulatum var. duboisii H88]|uniref:Predicted protein n=2 Tax=Ajellomyces capsulatus TaxID=5037 RepID=F0U847_AJEC8|nr:predicted protein [Histoplasma capsulatum H143]EGC41660.1 predicted protein [Histoplasma capsulatum var. duboisii H88]
MFWKQLQGSYIINNVDLVKFPVRKPTGFINTVCSSLKITLPGKSGSVLGISIWQLCCANALEKSKHDAGRARNGKQSGRNQMLDAPRRNAICTIVNSVRKQSRPGILDQSFQDLRAVTLLRMALTFRLPAGNGFRRLPDW